jgi:hypothetical protein
MNLLILSTGLALLASAAYADPLPEAARPGRQLPAWLYVEPGRSLGGSQIAPLRSRDLISAITASGTLAGIAPSITKPHVPGAQRACHHPVTTRRKV